MSTTVHDDLGSTLSSVTAGRDPSLWSRSPFEEKTVSTTPTKFKRWRDDLPPAVAVAYDKLVKSAERTTIALPKAPQRTTLSITGSLSAVSPTGHTSTSVAVSTSRVRTTESCCDPKPRERGLQCSLGNIELDAARERVRSLEEALQQKLTQSTITGVDRLCVIEMQERRAIEAFHNDLIRLIVGAWECVRISAVNTALEVRKRDEAETELVALREELLREKEHASSLERMQIRYKDALQESHLTAADTLKFKQQLDDEISRRAALEVNNKQLSLDRRELKMRVKTLEGLLSNVQADVSSLSQKHQNIVGELELSLQRLLSSEGSCQQNEPSAVSTSPSCASCSTTAAVADAEKKRMHLYFEFQEAVKELREAKSVVRSVRASLAEAVLKQQQAESRTEDALNEVKKLKQINASLKSEISRLNDEVLRRDGMSKELGRCRGQLAILERQLLSQQSLVANMSSEHGNAARRVPSTIEQPRLFTDESISSVEVVDD